MERKDLHTTLLAIGLIANLIALGNPEYSYYQILRVYNFIIFAFLTYGLYKINKKVLFLFSLFFLIINNPFEKIGFDKETWAIFNIVTSITFGLILYKLKPTFFNIKTSVKKPKSISERRLSFYQSEIVRLKR